MSGTDEIKLNYEQAADMANTFKQGADQLEQTMREMQAIAQTLEEGALLGDGGAAFADALRSLLAPAINKLSEKFQELQGDVLAAMAAMRQADADSKSQFR